MEEEIVDKKTEEGKKKKRTSLKSILGGDILATDFFRRQTKLLVLIMVFVIFYIHNRYASQQQQIEIDRLKKELIDIKYDALDKIINIGTGNYENLIGKSKSLLNGSGKLRICKKQFQNRHRKMLAQIQSRQSGADNHPAPLSDHPLRNFQSSGHGSIIYRIVNITTLHNPLDSFNNPVIRNNIKDRNIHRKCTSLNKISSCLPKGKFEFYHGKFSNIWNCSCHIPAYRFCISYSQE